MSTEQKVMEAAHRVAISCRDEAEFRRRLGSYMGKVLPYLGVTELEEHITDVGIPIFKASRVRPESLTERVKRLEELVAMLLAKHEQ